MLVWYWNSPQLGIVTFWSNQLKQTDWTESVTHEHKHFGLSQTNRNWQSQVFLRIWCYMFHVGKSLMPLLPILCFSKSPDWKHYSAMIRVTNSSASSLDLKLSNFVWNIVMLKASNGNRIIKIRTVKSGLDVWFGFFTA